MITQELMIDVNDKGAETIFSRVGEEDTREIVITPVSYVDGEPRPIVFDTENPTALFRMVKPDGTFVVKAMTRFSPESIVKFSVVLSGAMSQVAGVGYYDIRIYEEDSPDFIYTVQGLFQIDDDMITDSMIESVAEVNGLVFPDDFLTSADLDDYVTEEELEDYATKEYVNDAISHVDTKHTYSTDEQIIGTWIDGSMLYEKTLKFISPNVTGYDSTSDLVHGVSNIDEAWVETALYKSVNQGIPRYQNIIGGTKFNASDNTSDISTWEVGDRSIYSLTTSYSSVAGREFVFIIRYTKSL